MPRMTGRILLFVHSALGTLCIFVGLKAEELVGQQHKGLSGWLPYLGVFLILLLLDRGTEKLHEWLLTRRERRLAVAGRIEGYWLESSSNDERVYGAFIKIKYLPKSHFFEVGGPIFLPNGDAYGSFTGHGWADPGGERLLYEYTATHGDWRDYGTGDFTFSDDRKGEASAYLGSFYGAATKIVRNVRGIRTKLPDLVNHDATALEVEKRDAVVNFLKAGAKSARAK